MRQPGSGEMKRSPELESPSVGNGSGGGPFATAPDSIVYSNAQVTQPRELLDPITHAEQSDTVLVPGPPGFGKTGTTKSVIESK